MKRKSTRRPESREGTDGASLQEGSGEGVSEQQGGNALPEAPVTGGERGR